MADNPFDPKYALGLLGMLTNLPAQEPDNPLARALGLIPANPALPVSPLSAAVSDLLPHSTTVSASPFSSLTGLASVDLFQPLGSLASPRLPVAPLKAEVKRKAFFSFHYDDIMRVNVVRNAWKAVPNGVGGYNWIWNRYSDYSSSVPLPPWLIDPAAGYVTPLSKNASVYDYMADEGHRNIGSWIDSAAKSARR
jgi:hypothetical protein